MSCAIRPLRDKLYVKLREREQGLVIIPDFIEEKHKSADVISVGPEVESIKVGDCIKLFEYIDGWQVPGGIIVRESMVMGIESDNELGVTPINDRIAVLRDEQSFKGIILAPEKQTSGTIKALGSGRLLKNGIRLKPDVSVGDRVTFAKLAGTDIEINKKTYTLIREEDILTVQGE